MVEEITLKKRGYSEKSRANLKPFKKGEVHNPKGRPVKEQSITEALRELAPQVLEITIGGKKNTTKTAVQLMALGMYLKAIKGDASMAREIIDRLEGKVAQPISGEIGVYKGTKELTDEELSDIARRRSGGAAGASQSSPEPS